MASVQYSYHTLDIPLNPSPYTGELNSYSPLQELYPGRPMNVNWGLDEYDIPHEHPYEARKAFEEVREDTKKSAALLDALALHDGRGKKVLLHAVDDPVSLIEEPDLRAVDIVKPKDLDFPVKDNLLPIKENFQNESDDGSTSNLIYIIAIAFLVVLLCAVSVTLSRK